MPRRRWCVQDLFDFCNRVDLKRINKRTLEALIRSGALDRLGPYYQDELKAYQASVDKNRAVLLASMEEAVQSAEQTARSAESGHIICSAVCSPSPRPTSTPITARPANCRSRSA